MAASQIAAGIMSNSNKYVEDIEIDTLAKASVKIAKAIADEVPEGDSGRRVSDKEIKEILTRYCKKWEGVPLNKLNSLICTGEDMTSKKAYNVICRGEHLGIIENVGTQKASYILRD